MSLPEIITRLRSRKKPVRSTQTPTIASISTSTAPAQLTDVIKKFNDNTEDTALALEALKTDVDTKTATTINLSPTAINLPAESTANVTLQVENLTLLPDGFVFEPPVPTLATTIADTDLIPFRSGGTGKEMTFANFKAALPSSGNGSGSSGLTISGVIDSIPDGVPITLFTAPGTITLVSYKLRWAYAQSGYFLKIPGVNEFEVSVSDSDLLVNFVLTGNTFIDPYTGGGIPTTLQASNLANPTVTIPLYWEITYLEGLH